MTECIMLVLITVLAVQWVSVAAFIHNNVMAVMRYKWTIFLYQFSAHLVQTDLPTDLYINNLDTGLASLSIANGDPLKLTSPAQHGLRG